MPAPKRPKYFQSQFLVVRDFQDEQTYHQEMLRHHNSLMHDWGVVRDGLVVTKTNAGFNVGSGSAIDSLGREIVLDNDYALTSAAVTAAGADVSITIAFQEKDSGEAADQYPGGNKDVTRIIQSPQILAIASPPADGTVIILARVKANGDLDNSVRKQAGGFLRTGGLYINGAVGIGTTSAQAPLHIKNNAALLNLEGDNHGFVQFFPKGFTAGRKGWLGYGDAADSNLRIKQEGTGNVILSALQGYVGAVGSGGEGQGIQFGSREIKFRGDGLQHFSIFANKISRALTFARSGSNEAMDTVGVHLMTIAESGNVGIGTTTPESQLQIGDGCNRIGLGPTLDDRFNPTLYNADYGTAYLGFNAVRTAQGWSRSSDGGNNNGGSIIYNRIQGDLCFVTLETNSKAFFSDSEIKDRRRMIIEAGGNVGIGTPGRPEARLHLGSGTLQIGTSATSVTTIDSKITHTFGDETAPRYTIDRDLLGLGQAGLGFNMRKVPSGTLAANGAAVGMPADRTLAFSTSDGTSLVERMRIDGDGKVSIAKDLSVAGLLNATGLSVTNEISAVNGVRLNAKPLSLKTDGTSGLCYFGGGTRDAVGDFAIDGPVVYGYSGGALGIWRDKAADKKVILGWNDSGNVGIGTADPQAKLVVQQAGELSAIDARRMLDEAKAGLQLHLDFSTAKDGKVKDLSPKNKDGTLFGTQLVTDATFGNCVNFNGTSDYLTVPDLGDFSSGLTIAAWVFYQSLQSWSRIIDFGNGSSSNNILLANDGVTGDLTLAVYVTTGAGATAVPTNKSLRAEGVLKTGQWMHVAATINTDGKAQLYVDGMAVAGPGDMLLPSNLARSNNYVGKSNWPMPPDKYFSGKMASLRIYNRALTAGEIEADKGDDRSTVAVTADLINSHSAGKAVFVSAKMGSGRSLDGAVEVRHASLRLGIGLGYDTIYATGSRARQGLTIKGKGGGNVILNPDSGNVGIGTADPTKAKLEVSGSAQGSLGDYSYLAFRTSKNVLAGDTIGYFKQLADYSIYASARIAAAEFNAFSDGRIKNIQGRSNSAADLQTLLAIEVTDFRYRDVVGKGNTPQKKVVAQQVEKIFPQAVSEHTDVVPDIYQPASFADGWIDLATNLKKGERVKLFTDKDEGVYEVIEVMPDKFRADFKAEGDKVFVFGREVDDFRNVDYDAIAMLNVSATQQLKKEKDEEVKTLQSQIADLQAANDALSSRLQILESKMASALSVVAAINGSNGDGSH